jgi:DNA-binding NarL/FixJ family response regulator
MTKHSILLVDDEESIRFAVSKDLKNNGYNVSVAENGEEAIKKLDENPFNLIITDMVMEKVDGLQVLKAAKKVRPEPEAILFTGFGELPSAVKAFKLGVFDYIEKPCSSQSLLTRVQSALNQFDLKQNLEKKKKNLLDSNEKLKIEIKERKLTEKLLNDFKDELENQVHLRTRELENKNIALGQILGRLEIEKKRLQQAVESNVETIILPILKKFRTRSTENEIKTLTLLEEKLREITGCFGLKITNSELQLTPRETEISSLIKSGLSTKEIADFLGVSPGTIDTHRNNIREKLGLNNQSINLTTYLKSL